MSTKGKGRETKGIFPGRLTLVKIMKGLETAKI